MVYFISKLNMSKQILILATVAILATALLLTSVTVAPVDAAAKKPTKCNNVKVQIKVNGVEENQTVVATAQIGSSAKTKSGVVEANETSITIPLNFKKISPCPAVGSEIFGNVNGTGFTGELKSLKKPNKITVDL